jgi:hypothetical protein
MVVKQKSGTKVRDARQKRAGRVQPASWPMIIQNFAGGMQFVSGEELQSRWFSLLPAGTQFDQENQSAGNEYGKGD